MGRLVLIVILLLSLGVAAAVAAAFLWSGSDDQGQVSRQSAQGTQATAATARSIGQEGKSYSQIPWRRECSENDREKQRCRVLSSIVDEQNVSVALMSIGKSPTEEPGEDALTVFVNVPPGIDISYGFTLTVDALEPRQGSFLTCGVEGCLGLLVGDDDVIADFRRGAAVVMKFRIFQGRTLTVPMSLNGFTSASAGI